MPKALLRYIIPHITYLECLVLKRPLQCCLDRCLEALHNFEEPPRLSHLHATGRSLLRSEYAGTAALRTALHTASVTQGAT